ncbi:hypothetical protein QQ045_010430 [Rhodiola kirilowii]
MVVEGYGFADDVTRDRPYGHCLVAGISKYPKKVVIRKDSKEEAGEEIACEIVSLNYSHIVMPTSRGTRKVTAAKEGQGEVRGEVQDWEDDEQVVLFKA